MRHYGATWRYMDADFGESLEAGAPARCRGLTLGTMDSFFAKWFAGSNMSSV